MASLGPLATLVWFGLVVLCATSCRRGNVDRLPAQKHLVAAALSARPESSALVDPSVASVESTIVPLPAPPSSPSSPSAAPPPGCAPQLAQQFLIDAHLRTKSLMTGAGQAVWWATLQRSIRYRTEQYGYYEGFGSPALEPAFALESDATHEVCGAIGGDP